MRAPAVQRVAPSLPGVAEQIGWHARHSGRLAVRVQFEQARVRPHLGAVVGDEDGRVADDPDGALVGVALERMPLAEETPLAERPEGHAFGAQPGGLLHRQWVPPRQRLVPVGPVQAAEAFGQGHEQRVIVEPALLRLAKQRQVGAFRRRGACGKAGGRSGKVAHAVRHHELVVDPVGIERRRQPQVIGVEPAALLQFVQVDQQQIAGKRGRTHVRRVAGPDATERQDLPQRLTRASQPVDEVAGRQPQIAGAVWAGQGGRVQQHAAGAWKAHGGILETAGGLAIA